MTVKSKPAYPARTRKAVRADLVARNAYAPTPDCRGDGYTGKNTSGTMYGVTSGRWDVLAQRTRQGDLDAKAREETWVEKTFAYEGLAIRKAGRNKLVDPDMGPSRPERDAIDATVRTRGEAPAARPAPRPGTYRGAGTEAVRHDVVDMKVRHKAPKGRLKIVGEIAATQTTGRVVQQARKSVFQATSTD